MTRGTSRGATRRSARGRVSPSEASQERLWSTRGPEDVSFQRGAQITWWSVLGGLAVAALLTRLDALQDSFRSGSWHHLLYFLASCLIIVNSWVQTAWGSLILKWTMDIPTSLALFFQGLSLGVASLNVTQPATWAAAVFVVILTAEANQLFLMRAGAWSTLPAAMIARARAGLFVYLAFALAALAAAIHLALRPTSANEIVWGVVSLLAAAAALVRQHQGMTEERRSMGVR